MAGDRRVKMPNISPRINPISGTRLKKLISEQKLKQCDLAKEINISQKHLSNIITGKKALTLENAQILAEKFGVRYEYLLGTDDFATDEEMTACFNQAWEEAEKEDSVFPVLFELAGFKVQPQRETLPDNSTIRTGYKILHGDNSCTLCTETDITALINELIEYTEFKLYKLCDKKGQQ